MPGMFDGYDNLNANYTPNNLCSIIPTCPIPQPKLDPCTPKKPYEEYNVENELIGYWWYYGDAIILEFNISGEVTVGNTDIIYAIHEETPTQSTVGTINQKAFNIIDSKSWTCTAIDTDIYTWVEDAIFIDPEVDSGRNIYVTAQDFLIGKKVQVELFNFRYESIVKQIFDGNTQILFSIDKELSQTLVKGVYYCSLVVFDDNGFNTTIFNPDDCVLNVK